MIILYKFVDFKCEINHNKKAYEYTTIKNRKGNMSMHSAVWGAIDMVAKNKQMSRSGLARFSGLDATTFNISKRFESSGKPHWPAMNTVIKVLIATGTSMTEFGRICDEIYAQEENHRQ